MWYWSVPAGNYSRIVAIALLFGWGMAGFGDLRLGRAQAIVAALLAFLTCAAASTFLAATDFNVGFAFVETLLKIVLPFLVGITLVNSVQRLKQLAWVIMLCQGYVALEMNLSYYGGFNRVHEIGFGGMDNNCVAIAMVTGVGLAFFLALSEAIWWRRLLALISAVLMVHTILFSFSRGGLLSLIVTGATAFLLLPKRPKYCAYFLLAVLIGWRLAGQEVVKRFSTAFAAEETRDESAQSRLNLWGTCWKMMLAEPLLGVGPDHFPLRLNDYGSHYARGKEAHTLWLQIGAELGFPGLASLLTFYGICVWRLWPVHRSRTLTDPWLADAARMVIAALVGFMFSAQFVSLEGLELPYYVTLVGAGVLKLDWLSSLEEPQEVAVGPWSLAFEESGRYHTTCR
jgi:probable O-glycosylation ligase (exosortase A-associated)